MASKSNDYAPQKYRKYNGQRELKALGSIGNKVSADDLVQHISEEIGELTKRVLPELEQVLRRGIIDGSLVRTETYSLVDENTRFQVDSAPRRKRRYLNDIEVDTPKRRRVSKPVCLSERRNLFTYDEEDEEEDDDEQGEEFCLQLHFTSVHRSEIQISSGDLIAPRLTMYESINLECESEDEDEVEEEEMLEDDESLHRLFTEFTEET